MLSRTEAESFRNQAFILACQIGLRPAARALGLKETRLTKWASRYKWNISAIRPDATRADLSPSVISPVQALQNVMAVEADRTRSAMARTARRAFEHCDDLTEDELHKMDRAIALEKHGRVASIAHQWNNTGNQVAVQVNVPMPTQSERDEMRALDAKLDAIAAKLK